jgi:hypothetical protein
VAMAAGVGHGGGLALLSAHSGDTFDELGGRGECGPAMANNASTGGENIPASDKMNEPSQNRNTPSSLYVVWHSPHHGS